MNTQWIKFWFLAVVMVATGCAAPSEPASLSSSGVDSSKKSDAANGKDVKSAGGGFDFGGALVGDEAMQKKVSECLSAGTFFDRKEIKCTTMALAQMTCRDAAIKSSMSADRRAQFEALLSGSLAGFLVDQCLDCSSPAGNAACEGTGATKQTAPGYRIYLVKPESSMIKIQTVYIAK